MNLMPLVNMLEQKGLGVQGATLFLNMLPSEATQAILLRNPLTGTKINYELPGYYRTEFQLIVRAPGDQYEATFALCQQVVLALTLNETRVEDHVFKFSRPLTDPVVFPLSIGNLNEFNVMFECVFTKQ